MSNNSSGKKMFYWIYPLIVLAVIGLIGLFALTVNSAEYDAKVYLAPDCGCCGLHANYLKGDLNVETEVVNQRDLYDLKKEYKISTEIQSCHTSIIEGYIVEGHMPKEIIVKLLEDRPDIAGIALPNMPSGSPGMPGEKTAEWNIYTINHDGSTGKFTSF